MYDVRADSIKDGDIVDGLKLGEIKRQLAGEQDESLKEDVELDQLDENQNTGTDQETNGEGEITISLINGTSIVAKSKTAPSEYTGGKEGGEGNPENSLVLSVKTKRNGGEDQKNEFVKSEEKIELYGNNQTTLNLVTVKQLQDGNTAVTTAQSNLTTAENNFKNNPSTELKKIVNEKKKDLKDAERDLATLTKDFASEITAEAYFTKFKNKTKVTQTFTVTENGII